MLDEVAYKLLQLIQQTPQLSQRDMAENLGISLGKANTSIKLLLEKGLIRIHEAVRRSPTIPYIYTLTPLGIRELPRIAARFLVEKENEIRELQEEIRELRKVSARARDKGGRK